MKTLCIIPVYNEHNKLNNLIDQIKKSKFTKYNLKYIFVNNGSNDGSLKLIKNSKINFLNLKKNKGVGYALMLGYLYGKKYKYDFIVHLAGNGKMKPHQISNLMDKIILSNYDFVSGSRFLKGSSRKNNPFIRIFLIKTFSIFLKLLINKNITDATCGFRAFKINIFHDFKNEYFNNNLYSYGYEYYTFGKILRSKKIKYIEVPVDMDYPSKTNYSKIRPILDWYIILKYWIKGLISKREL